MSGSIYVLVSDGRKADAEPKLLLLPRTSGMVHGGSELGAALARECRCLPSRLTVWTTPAVLKTKGDGFAICGIDKSAGELLQVFINIASNKSTVVTAESGRLVSDLKKMVETKAGIPASLQHLTFAGKPLRDGITLADYGMHEGSNVHLSVPLNGGDAGGMVGGLLLVDPAKTANLVTMPFSRSDKPARPGMSTKPGLCLEVRCANPSSDHKAGGCEFRGKRMICNRRFGTVVVTEEQLRCPECNNLSPLHTVAFNNCVWSYRAVRVVGGVPTPEVSPMWTTAGHDYSYFDTNKADAKAQFARLEFATLPALPAEQTPEEWFAAKSQVGLLLGIPRKPAAVDDSPPRLKAISPGGPRMDAQWLDMASLPL